MIGSQRSSRRWSVLSALVGVGALAVGGVGMATAGADETPGSGLGSLTLSATTSSLRVVGLNTGPGGEDVEAEVPYAEATLGTGGLGHAVSSIAWPGATGAHAGSLLQLLGGGCLPGNPNGVLPVNPPCAVTPPNPPDSVYSTLNDPLKAEAQTGHGDPTTTLSQPGVSMTATATEAKVLADTELAGGRTLPGATTFGASHATSSTVLTGPKTAVADAVSSIRDITVGPLHISALTSKAHGTSDGSKASGTGSTTLSGATIGSIPVTIDETGLHVGPQGSSLAEATQQVNTVLKQTGLSVILTKPTKKVTGANVSVDSGALILAMNNSQYTSQANAGGQVIVLGGADIVANAGNGFGLTGLPVPPAVTGVTGTTGGSTSALPASGTGGALPDSGGGVSLPSGGSGGNAAPVVADQHPKLAAAPSLLFGGLSPGWIALVVIGGGLVAAALRRLPDRLLAAPATICPLDDGDA